MTIFIEYLTYKKRCWIIGTFRIARMPTRDYQTGINLNARTSARERFPEIRQARDLARQRESNARIENVSMKGEQSWMLARQKETDARMERIIMKGKQPWILAR